MLPMFPHLNKHSKFHPMADNEIIDVVKKTIFNNISYDCIVPE